MSDIARRITTIFEARQGNVLAVLGGMRTGFNQAGQGARQWGRDMGYLNSQWRAFGTTFRYAIAGMTTYGLAGTVSQLSQIERQLGQIAGISGLAGVKNASGGNIRLVGSNLRDMESDVRKASIDVVQPIGSINDAILGLLSTSQGLKQNEIVPIIEEIAKGATLAQTPIENLTQAAASMQIAFRQQPSLGNFKTFTRQWFSLIGLAPGLRAAGPQILNQFGPLASVFGPQGRGGQAQMLSLVLGSLRFGGSPSTALRGLQYLTQGIATPPSKQAAEALASIGITPQTTQRRGVYANLMVLLRHVTGLGTGKTNVGRLATLDDQTLDDIVSQFGEGATAQTPGIGSGAGVDFLRKATGRVHAARIALILASQLNRQGDVASLAEDLATMLDQSGQQQQAFVQGWQDFLDNAKLPQAAQSLQTIGNEIATQFQPILDFASRGVTGAGRAAQTREGHIGIWATAGLLAALGLKRGLGLPGLFRGGAQGALGLKTVSDLGGASGQWAGMPGESAIHPIYAIIVGQIVPPGIGGKKVPPVVTGGPGRAAEEGVTKAGKFSRALRFGAAFAVVPAVESQIPSPAGHHRSLLDEALKWSVIGSTINLFRGNGGTGHFLDNTNLFGRNRNEKRVIPADIVTAMSNLGNALQGKGALLVGQAHITVDVNTTDANGVKSTVRKGVDLTLLPEVFKTKTQKAPQTRGRPITPRGGQ